MSNGGGRDSRNGDGGLWMRRAKAIAVIIGALATAITAMWGAIKPTGEEAAEVSTEVNQRLIELQRRARYNTAKIHQIQAQTRRAKAEAAALRTFVSGFLLGQLGQDEATKSKKANPRTSSGGDSLLPSLPSPVAKQEALKTLLRSAKKSLEQQDERPQKVPELRAPRRFQDILKK